MAADRQDGNIVLAAAIPVPPMIAPAGETGLHRPAVMRTAIIRDVIKETHGLSYYLAAKAPVSVTLYRMNGDTIKTWDIKPGALGARAGTNFFHFPSIEPGTYMAEIAVDTAYGVYTVTERVTLP
jgi:hypothetical protein